MCVYIPHHLYTFICWWILRYLGCFHILAIVNNVVRNIGVHVYFRFNVFIFFEYISRSGISGLYDSSTFSFLRTFPTVFHDDCANLHFCQKCPLSQHTHQHLLSMVFLMIAIPTRIKWYLIVVLICTSLTVSWEGLGAGGEGDDRGWDGWMASPTRWTWVWVNSRSWWWTGRPGMLWFMGSQRVGHDWVTDLNWTVSYVEHLFVLLLAISMSSLEKCLFKSSAHFLTGLFICFAIELYELFIYFDY